MATTGIEMSFLFFVERFFIYDLFIPDL